MFRLFAVAVFAAAAAGPVEAAPLIWAILHGASPADARELVTAGALPSNGVLAETSGRLRSVKPIDPALTATARVTALTGAPPSRHGIVGNIFRRDGDAFGAQSSGFQTRWETEAIWEAAERQGKEVIRIGTLFLRGRMEEPVGDLALASGGGLTASKVESFVEGGRAWTGADPRFGRVLPLALEDGRSELTTTQAGDLEPFSLRAAALGASEGGAFSAVALDHDGDFGNGVLAVLAPGEWAPVALNEASPRAGLWVKLLDVDAATGEARLYVGGAYVNRGHPAEFLEEIESVVGFYPGAPDYDAHRRGDIDEATFMEQVRRENAFYRDAALAAMRRPFDLLIFEQPAIDNTVHQFLLTGERQKGFADESGDKGARYARHINESYEIAEANIGAVAAAAPSAKLVLSSDYSLLPAHTRYDVNAVLAGAGVKTGTGTDAEARAVASATSAHIYLNPDNHPLETDRARRAEEVAALLRNFRDLSSGEAVFADVMTRKDLAANDWLHPAHSGDLWVRARAGYTLIARTDRFVTLADEPFLRGEHGYPAADGGVGLFAVIGEKGSESGPICAVNIAREVARLLAIDPPAGAAPCEK